MSSCSGTTSYRRVEDRSDASGPTFASRNAAIVQAAVFDAANAITRSYTPFLVDVIAPASASIEAAVASAASRALELIYPGQAGTFDAALTQSLAQVPDGPAEEAGVTLGRSVAEQIVAARPDDGSAVNLPYTPGTEPGDWQPTPPDYTVALGADWGQVAPFTLDSVEQFCAVCPLELTSAEYTAAYNQVKELGGADSATRTPEQTEIGIFWAYDRAGLGTPVALFNKVAATVAKRRAVPSWRPARLLALGNLAMADAIITAWDAKYDHDLWRPITAIRNGDADGNPDTVGDPNWEPLAVPGGELGPTTSFGGHGMFSKSKLHRLARATAQAQILEPRIVLDADVQSIDGSGNNLLQPQWGAAGTALLRLIPAAYADGVSSPAGADRPSARAISNAVAAHPEDEVLNASGLAAFVYAWGQFIDHDLDLTAAASPAEPFNIAVPAGDEFFDPGGTGTQTIALDRSAFAEGTGVTSPREQLNEITAYLDGSMIYGSDETRAAALREFSGGRLRIGSDGLLPLNTEGLPNDNAGSTPDDQLFLAGDVRANENIELTALQTLFVREHNRLAGEIAASNPSLSDEEIYQQARRLVIGEIQNITYSEFLPALLGAGAIPAYCGYDPGVDAGISNAFSTAAFRVGHSMLANDVEFIGNDGNEVDEALPLAEAFFNPAAVQEHGIDPILKYLASSNAEEVDTLVVDGMRNFLFGAPGSGGLDLASLNIQRGRDHGLASYNDTREALGLPRLTSFDQISSDPEVAAKLASVYNSVDDIDLWVGGLAEDHVSGSNVGETFQRILVDQFTRTRNGDRFWFENVLGPSEQQ